MGYKHTIGSKINSLEIILYTNFTYGAAAWTLNEAEKDAGGRGEVLQVCGKLESVMKNNKEFGSSKCQRRIREKQMKVVWAFLKDERKKNIQKIGRNAPICENTSRMS